MVTIGVNSHLEILFISHSGLSAFVIILLRIWTRTVHYSTTKHLNWDINEFICVKFSCRNSNLNHLVLKTCIIKVIVSSLKIVVFFYFRKKDEWRMKCLFVQWMWQSKSLIGQCSRFSYLHKEGRYRDKTSRYMHGITNASAVKLYILICPTCGKEFAIRADLTRHRRKEDRNDFESFNICSYKAPSANINIKLRLWLILFCFGLYWIYYYSPIVKKALNL